MANGELGDVLNFPGSHSSLGRDLKGVQFDGQFTKDVIGFYDQMGTDPRFLAILGRHVSDTHLMISSVIGESFLTTRQTKDTSSEREQTSWERLLILSETQRSMYAKAIEAATKSMSKPKRAGGIALGTLVDLKGKQLDSEKTMTRKITRDLSLDWIFYELTSDMLANSIYMQQRFDHYIPDFNGQSPHYRTEFTIAREFLSGYASDEFQSERDHAVLREFRNFRAGVALGMLADDMIRKEVAGSMTEALWITSMLAKEYPLYGREQKPIVPMGKVEMFIRLSSLEPRKNVGNSYLNLSLAYDH
jgi:hypothetical protein